MACGGVQTGDLIEVCFSLERPDQFYPARVTEVSSGDGPFYVESVWFSGRLRDICTEHGEGWHWRRPKAEPLHGPGSEGK